MEVSVAAMFVWELKIEERKGLPRLCSTSCPRDRVLVPPWRSGHGGQTILKSGASASEVARADNFTSHGTLPRGSQ